MNIETCFSEILRTPKIVQNCILKKFSEIQRDTHISLIRHLIDLMIGLFVVPNHPEKIGLPRCNAAIPQILIALTSIITVCCIQGIIYLYSLSDPYIFLFKNYFCKNQQIYIFGEYYLYLTEDQDDDLWFKTNNVNESRQKRKNRAGIGLYWTISVVQYPSQNS